MIAKAYFMHKCFLPGIDTPVYKSLILKGYEVNLDYINI